MRNKTKVYNNNIVTCYISCYDSYAALISESGFTVIMVCFYSNNVEILIRQWRANAHPLNIYMNLVLLFVHVGPLAARAALYTAGVVGGLSLTAACAPSEKYLRWSGPLSLGLGVVFVASIGKLSTLGRFILNVKYLKLKFSNDLHTVVD